jgi:hypothetical protein
VFAAIATFEGRDPVADAAWFLACVWYVKYRYVKYRQLKREEAELELRMAQYRQSEVMARTNPTIEALLRASQWV